MLPFKIAKRYLFGKKTSNAINLITGIAVLGIAIGSAALILILSVFNGFESLIAGLLNDFNADLKVTPIEGKYFNITPEDIIKLEEIEGINTVSKTLEEIAFFEYKGAQVIGAVKGVDEAFRNVTSIDSAIYSGRYVFNKNGVRYGLVGARLHNQLAINQGDALTPVKVHMPNKKKKGLVKKDYTTMLVYPSGIFSVQSEKEDQYLLSSYEFAAKLLGKKQTEASSLELKLSPGADEDDIRAALTKSLGTNFDIKNRYQQDEAFLKLMNIEKWISFLIVSLTLLIVAFNLVGALWMIVLDKTKDITILKSLGFLSKDIRNIFLWEGMLISGLGLVIGIILAITLYLLQKYVGLVPVPDGFIIDAYPIKLRLTDFFVVIVTVAIIGYIGSLLPAYRAAKVSPYLRID
jgi:lipoprotein-releasing system permease protein